MRIEVLTSQLHKSQEKENQSRTTESRLVMEVQLKSQELQHKCDAINDLKIKVAELKEEMKSTHDTVSTNFKESNQLAEVGNVLKFELSKVRDRVEQSESENQKLKDELSHKQRELNRLLENEVTLSRAADNGQLMVISLKQGLEDTKARNEELTSAVKEHAFREKQLERALDELQRARMTTPPQYQQQPPQANVSAANGVNPGFSESFIEYKIQAASSKTENKVSGIRTISLYPVGCMQNVFNPLTKDSVYTPPLKVRLRFETLEYWFDHVGCIGGNV